MPQQAWAPPPEPPRPERPPTRPATITAAVALMVVGAVIEVVRAVLAATDLEGFRDAMREDIAGDPAFGPDEAEAFLTIMSIVVVGAMVFFLFVGLVLWIWMIITNRRGRQWARITATVLGAVSFGMNVLDLALRPVMSSQPDVFGPQVTTGAAYVVLSVVYLLVIVAILVLLWLPASNAYVRDVSDQTRWERWARRFGRPSGQ